MKSPGTPIGARPDVIREISPKENVRTKPERQEYFRAGRSALHCVRSAMGAAQKEDATRILDFGCGYGRILRMLKQAFPSADITACDVQRDAVDFCAQTFGASPVYAHDEFDRTVIEDEFDLVWCGSVFTHLDAERWIQLLSLFASVLATDGLLVFSAHGRLVADRMRAGMSYGLTEDLQRDLLDDYERDGFGYRGYPNLDSLPFPTSRYGISLSSPAWVCSLLERFPSHRLVAYMEQGWNLHQDVAATIHDREETARRGVARRRRPSPSPSSS